MSKKNINFETIISNKMPKVETFNRKLVLDQATNVFHNKGYNASSMQDLVDATGLNRSSIYNSFGSKLDIFFECLKLYQTQAQEAFSKIIMDSKCPTYAIEGIFELYLNEITKDKENKGCLISNCTAEMGNQKSSITTFLSTNQDGMIALLEELIKNAQEKGDINVTKTSKDYALYLFSALQGFRMTGILINDKTQLRSIVDTTLQNLK